MELKFKYFSLQALCISWEKVEDYEKKVKPKVKKRGWLIKKYRLTLHELDKGKSRESIEIFDPDEKFDKLDKDEYFYVEDREYSLEKILEDYPSLKGKVKVGDSKGEATLIDTATPYVSKDKKCWELAENQETVRTYKTNSISGELIRMLAKEANIPDYPEWTDYKNLRVIIPEIITLSEHTENPEYWLF